MQGWKVWMVVKPSFEASRPFSEHPSPSLLPAIRHVVALLLWSHSRGRSVSILLCCAGFFAVLGWVGLDNKLLFVYTSFYDFNYFKRRELRHFELKWPCFLGHFFCFVVLFQLSLSRSSDMLFSILPLSCFQRRKITARLNSRYEEQTTQLSPRGLHNCRGSNKLIIARRA